MTDFSLLLKKAGWLNILTNIALILLGGLMIANANETQKVLVYILGSIIIFVGICKILEYLQTKGKYDLYNYDLLFGIVAIIIGCAVIGFSSVIGSLFRIIIAIWIIYSGLARLAFAHKLRVANLNSWIAVTIIATIILVCGIFVLLKSGLLISAVGIAIIVSAALDLIETFIFMVNVKHLYKQE